MCLFVFEILASSVLTHYVLVFCHIVEGFSKLWL